MRYSMLSASLRFEFVSKTIAHFCIVKLTKSLSTEFVARHTPHCSVHLSFSATLRYETGE